MTPANRLSVLDLVFDRLSIGEAARAIAAKADRCEPFAYVVTPNIDQLVRLPELRAHYRNAWLTLSDSFILELLAKARGIDLPAAPAMDIFETLARTYVRARDRVIVIGGSQATIDMLASRFGLANLVWYDAPHDLHDAAAVRAACVDFIIANPAPFIFLAVASPQQEMIASECLARGGAIGVALCCGASLGFLSGERLSAPSWMGARNLAWLYSLVATRMRLWPRYLIDGPQILRLWMKWRAAPQV